MRTSSDNPTHRTVPVLHPRKLTAVMLVCAFLFSAIALALPAAAEENKLSEQEATALIEKAVYLYWHFVDWETVQSTNGVDLNDPIPGEYNTEAKVSALARSIYPEEIADFMWMFGERTYAKHVENDRWVRDPWIEKEAQKSFFTDSNGFLQPVDSMGPNRSLHYLALAGPSITAQRNCVEITESSEEAAKGTVLIYIFEESPLGSFKTIDVEFKNTPAGWRISGGNLQLLLSPDAELAEYSYYFPSFKHDAENFVSEYWKAVSPETYEHYIELSHKLWHVPHYTDNVFYEEDLFCKVLKWDDESIEFLYYPDSIVAESPKGYLAKVKVNETNPQEFKCEFVGGSFKEWIDGNHNVAPYTGDDTPQTVLLCSAAMLLSAMGAHAVLKRRRL